MSLLDTLRLGVRIADNVTKPVQAMVTYERALAFDAYGKVTSYAGPVPLKAIVDIKARPVKNREGIVVLTSAVIDLLDVQAVSNATGGVGVGDHDKFILPSGKTGPILQVGGFVDAGTGQPLATQVMLG